ncbi:carboxymuconolactone decarboxylase family protein [Streptomyces sp. NBC_01795]|uniref:carboxymuconolactone decarboxylase family protein n=1 Tax=unclassified Streptomyces TaxID=2593676 RepID=UPI002DD8622F|nr:MULTISPECIES: carboxymuconolactone decarboxylase family protein [unclassified Streptomyces]WSA95638.1 carboxymuconolactone decarboxylase family protein [Streptomyces sp. NBC_01795]WSB80057.1 carboxymuconolactone decarboxylase family protein [Streptomyces sp. NBC_01775]WSS11735.1 carboxymuconolactone decarboxylase family protein [Streptomyces sp. NBC_01186]
MPRISLDPPRSLVLRLVSWYSRRKFGTVIEPVLAAGHHPGVLLVGGIFEVGTERWKALDPGLKQLALMASAARIECTWCMDFGHWSAEEMGLPMERVQHVPRWREHREIFSAMELDVMEYAEAMTDTPPRVPDELAERLLGRLGEKAFVELTMTVAVENMRSRTNSAFGLTGQGFSDHCEVPFQG